MLGRNRSSATTKSKSSSPCTSVVTNLKWSSCSLLFLKTPAQLLDDALSSLARMRLGQRTSPGILTGGQHSHLGSSFLSSHVTRFSLVGLMIPMSLFFLERSATDTSYYTEEQKEKDMFMVQWHTDFAFMLEVLLHASEADQDQSQPGDSTHVSWCSLLAEA